MKMKILIPLLLSIPLTACAASTGTFFNPSVPIEVKNGNRFNIELNSNITTGYSWDFGVPLEAEYVEVIKTYYTDPKSGLVGAGGTQGWVFEALKPGKTTITLAYRRPWEVNVPPLQTVTFQVEIH